MKEHLLILITSLLAGMLVMIFHELPKSILYNIHNKNQDSKTKRNVYKIMQYIDPIGLILFVSTGAGFSKPYMYRIKEKKTNFALGITGFISLFVLFIVSIGIFKFYYITQGELIYTSNIEFFLKAFPVYFIKNVALFSINLFLVNLIPISTFDLGLMVAGKSPSKYFSIINNDTMIKFVLLFIILFHVIQGIGILVANTILML